MSHAACYTCIFVAAKAIKIDEFVGTNADFAQKNTIFPVGMVIAVVRLSKESHCNVI